MPLVKQVFYVAVCPACKNRIDVNGEGGFTVFDKREEWETYLKESGCSGISDYCGCKRRAARKAAERKVKGCTHPASESCVRG